MDIFQAGISQKFIFLPLVRHDVEMNIQMFEKFLEFKSNYCYRLYSLLLIEMEMNTFELVAKILYSHGPPGPNFSPFVYENMYQNKTFGPLAPDIGS